MHETMEEQKAWNAWADAKIEQWRHLERRFEVLFGDSSAAADARRAREVMIDGDLAAIAATYRLAVVRQLFIILAEHRLIDYDADDPDVHLRAVAARVGLPYLELLQAFKAIIHNPETTRDDLDDWRRWCAEHAPERLEGGQ